MMKTMITIPRVLFAIYDRQTECSDSSTRSSNVKMAYPLELRHLEFQHSILAVIRAIFSRTNDGE